MKVSYITKALPLIALAIVVWQWSYIKSIAIGQKQSTLSGEQLAVEAPNNQMPAPTEIWRVTSVSDGDTITVVRGETEEKIRFCGIDAPEVSHGASPGQPLGTESKDNLQELIDEANSEVHISIVDTDRYGRKVAEVFTVLENQEKFLQEEQVKSGLAYHYTKYSNNCPNRHAIAKAEEIAQSSRSGVWSDKYEKPWDFRKVQRQQDTTASSNDSKVDSGVSSSQTPVSQDKAISYQNISLANTLQGHSSSVSSLAISPDEKTLVSNSLDGTIKIWDLSNNGTLKSTFTDSSSINSVIFSPDGQTLISGSESTIKIWDLSSGTVKSIVTEKSGANFLDISPDGQSLVSSQGKTIKIWDLSNGTLRNTITAHSSNVNFLDIKVDGKTLTSGSDDQTLKEWDLSSGSLKKVTPDNLKDVILAFSADRKVVVGTDASEYNTVTIGNINSKAIEGKINKANPGKTTALGISSDRQTIVIGSTSGNGNTTIEIWRVL